LLSRTTAFGKFYSFHRTVGKKFGLYSKYNIIEPLANIGLGRVGKKGFKVTADKIKYQRKQYTIDKALANHKPRQH
jgi:hypothetical protein